MNVVGRYRRWCFRAIIATCPLLGGDALADAATFDVQTFKTTDGQPLTVIIVDGELMFGDESKFIDAAIRAPRAVVMLGSPGGSAVAGIEIGKAIRLKGFATYVPEGITCASACAVAWLGGIPRFMSERSRIGFHAMYEKKNGQPEISGPGNAALGAYLNQLGISATAIEYITQAQPSEIQWLTFADAQRFGIEVKALELQNDTAKSAPVQSPQHLPMDMRKYCQENYGPMARAIALDPHDASSWRCRTGIGLVGISLSKLCHQQYGDRYRYALGDGHDASTWSCVPSP